MLGKAHHNRPARGTWKAWKAVHLPLVFAFQTGDMGTFVDLAWQRTLAVDDAWQSPAWCIECRALMLVSDGGFHYCPYADAGPKAHAFSRITNLTRNVVPLRPRTAELKRVRRVYHRCHPRAFRELS